ncbi:hypothetical protein [Planctomyces sp. SH-PL62]|uniref:hypothetical protein n=1 Tax=Planctomyces sp. SH-PL62 TaxID=1636152 RepID=UPI00078B67C7|nr:hypothetical protein [Planctomyces sp. SH-PL62]AMV38494.1 hypothetical protein VT85_13745 [Planctomyces sp. SH-PL62]
MTRTDENLVKLFVRLREELRDVPAVGLALKAQGGDVTLRVRSEETAGDERSPFFALVVGAAERDGAYRISYRPSGTPLAEPGVTIVAADSADELFGLVWDRVDAERRRIDAHRGGA